MGKANDKKVVRQARDTLLAAIGNLLESHRERTFRTPNGAIKRQDFCREKHLNKSTVAHIETGRFLGLTVNKMRLYLAATHHNAKPTFATSLKKVYDGLKEIDGFLDTL